MRWSLFFALILSMHDARAELATTCEAPGDDLVTDLVDPLLQKPTVDPNDPVGEPINPANGEVYSYLPADFVLKNDGSQVEFLRSYRSLAGERGMLGVGWGTNFDARVLKNASSYTYTDWKGSHHTFIPSAGGEYTASSLPTHRMKLEDDGALALVRDEAGVITRYDLKQKGRIAEQRFANGQVYTYSWSENSLEVRDPWNKGLKLTLKQGRLQEVSSFHMDGKRRAETWLMRFTYGTQGELTAVRKANGEEQTYVYAQGRDPLLAQIKDGEGRTVAMFRYDGSGKGVYTKALEGEYQIKYLELDRRSMEQKVEVTNAATGKSATLVYNASGKLLSRSADVGVGKYDRKEYGAQGVTTEENAQFSARTGYQKGKPTSYQRDFHNKEARDLKTSFKYEHPLGFMTQAQRPSNLFAGGFVTTNYVYQDNLLKKVEKKGYTLDRQGKTVPHSEVTSYQHNAQGQITLIRMPSGEEVRFRYYGADEGDNSGRLRETRQGKRITQYVGYDFFGSPLGVSHNGQAMVWSKTDALGKTVVGMDGSVTIYDRGGLVRQQMGSDTDMLRAQYDDTRRLQKVQFVERDQTTAYGDLAGMSTEKVARKMLEGLDFAFDENGRLRALAGTTATGEDMRVEFEFDLMGKMSKVAYGNGFVQESLWDDFGRLVLEQDRHNGRRIHLYGKSGKKTQTVLANGQTISYQDEGGKRSVRSEQDTLYRMTVEKNGARAFSNGTWEVSNRLDIDGRIIAQDWKYQNRSLWRMEYGSPSTENYQLYPGGEKVVTENFPGTTSASRVSVLTADGQVRELFALDTVVAGELRTRAMGMPVTKTYNKQGLPQAVSALGHAARYQNSAGLISAVQTSFGDSKFIYDARARLVEVRSNAGRATASYDLYGHPQTGAGAEFDQMGRLTRWGGITYTYDNFNHLVLSSKEGVATRYHYDPFGRRVQKIGPKGETRYAYDSRDRLVHEEEVSQNRTTSYYYNDRDLIAFRVKQAGEESWYSVVNDHLGAPLFVYNEARQLVAHARHRGYAVDLLTPKGEAFELLKLGLPGHYRDDESGLQYNVNRYFAPTLASYTTPDPTGLSGGMNLYAYARANPLAFRDPLGLQAERAVIERYTRPGFTSHCEANNNRDADQSIAALEASNTEGTLWNVGNNRWTLEREREFSAWVDQHVDSEFFENLGVFNTSNSNHYALCAGSSCGIDCADTPFFLRAIFSRLHHLPMVLTNDARAWNNYDAALSSAGAGGGKYFIRGHMSRTYGVSTGWDTSNCTVGSAQCDLQALGRDMLEDRAFRSFIREVRANIVGTEMLPENTFPVKVAHPTRPNAVLNECFSSGNPLFHTPDSPGGMGHTQFRACASRNADGTCADLRALAGYYPPISTLHDNDFQDYSSFQEQKAGKDGMVRWNWAVQCEGRWQQVPDRSMPCYSADQYYDRIYDPATGQRRLTVGGEATTWVDDSGQTREVNFLADYAEGGRKSAQGSPYPSEVARRLAAGNMTIGRAEIEAEVDKMLTYIGERNPQIILAWREHSAKLAAGQPGLSASDEAWNTPSRDERVLEYINSVARSYDSPSNTYRCQYQVAGQTRTARNGDEYVRNCIRLQPTFFIPKADGGHVQVRVPVSVLRDHFRGGRQNGRVLPASDPGQHPVVRWGGAGVLCRATAMGVTDSRAAINQLLREAGLAACSN